MTVEEYKTAFAFEMLKNPGDALRAITVVLGVDHSPSERMRLSQTWVTDEFVVQETARLLEEFGEDHFLPSKAEVARLVYRRAVEAQMDHRDFHDLIELYCKVRGLIERPAIAPSANITTTTNTTNVMVIKDTGTNEEWQKGLEEQQRLLIEAAVDIRQPN